MRIGFNPSKNKEVAEHDFFHQVIIPVYIPNFEGYFKDSFQIFKYSIESLFKTSHHQTYFTIINNGSCREVTDYLDQLYKEAKIQELMHTTAIGKLNAILKGVTGHNFPLVTITDADVLFLNNWQQSTYDVFETFPKAGVVSTTPNSKMVRYLTSGILFDNLFSKQLFFTDVKNPKALSAFAHSIGKPDLFNVEHLKKILTLSKGEQKAVVGAGHFVATYKGSVFDNWTTRFSVHSLGGKSINNLLDKPIAEKGYWRLSTQDNFTYHMGNVPEDWMISELNDLVVCNQKVNLPNLVNHKENYISAYVKVKLFSKVIFNKFVWKWFIAGKGLTKVQAEKY
ncbi:glycosyltransferase family 2 protein [Flavobacterium enshiense]|uniref:glycosyltransferase family 2 protein n=1 Tax=Flavobacterium enshiense TaxID=1341165 RepID=UPI00345C624F